MYGNVNTIDFSVTDNPASANQDRFSIIFTYNNPLPVTFTSIKAIQQNKDIAVGWTVSNQQNIKQYEVEKSTDGINFAKAATQNVVGANDSSASYTWLDNNPLAGDNFYRIRSLSNNGDIKYSETVDVKINNGKQEITIFPNPVINYANLTVQSAGKTKLNLTIFDATGKKIIEEQISLQNGLNKVPLNFTRFSQGVYFVQLVDDNNVKKVIKVLKN